MQLVPRQGGELSVGGPAEQVTEVWLANRRLSEHTRAAYRRDVSGWLAWCAERAADPLRVSFLDVNAYARGVEAQSLAPATVETADAAGWSADALEAQAFAFLAVRSLRGLPLTFPATTGVATPMRGGLLAQP
jgi:hypothetical protein